MVQYTGSVAALSFCVFYLPHNVVPYTDERAARFIADYQLSALFDEAKRARKQVINEGYDRWLNSLNGAAPDYAAVVHLESTFAQRESTARPSIAPSLPCSEPLCTDLSPPSVCPDRQRSIGGNNNAVMNQVRCGPLHQNWVYHQLVSLRAAPQGLHACWQGCHAMKPGEACTLLLTTD